MKKLFLLLILFLGLSGFSYGQRIERDVIATAGDYFSVHGLGLSWTLGEVMVENYFTNSATVHQGFQQPFNFFGFLFKSLNEPETDAATIDSAGIEPGVFSVKIYPNPSDHFINIDLSPALEPGSFVEILDMFGRSILIENLNELETKKLDVSSLNSGIYILQIKQANSTIIKSFKINKIN